MKHNTMSKRLRCTTAVLPAALAAMSLVAFLASCEDEDDTIVYETVYNDVTETITTTEYAKSDYSGTSYDIDVVQQYTVGEDGYVSTSALTISGLSLSFDFSSATANEVTNNDASSTWWSDNSATSSTGTLTGDFAVRYTWDNTTEPDDSSVVIQLTDGSAYWDWTIGEATSGGWGDLYTGVTETAGCFTGDGEAAPWVYRTSDTGEFGGTYETLIVRTGSTLVVNVSIYHTAGGYQVSSYTIVQTGFSEDDLTACLTGNTYYIDSIVYYTGSASVTGSVSIEESEESEEDEEEEVSAAESITINDTTYTLSSMSAAAKLTNNDTSWTWWDGSTDTVSLSGDFALYLTWEQSSDNYPDNVLELYCDADNDDENEYWDWTVVTNGVGWGDLMGTAGSNFTCTLVSGTVSLSDSSGNEGTSYLGTWEAYLVRVGSTLAVYVAGGGNGGAGYECHITQTDFTTSDVTFCITGNPAAGIDSGSLYYQQGTASK